MEQGQQLTNVLWKIILCNILAFSNNRAKTLGGLSGVLWRGQKPGPLCTVSSGGSLALTPAHIGRPNRD